MKDYVKIFKNNLNYNNELFIKGAIQCLEKFSASFENEDIKGMDSCCHFPHYLISGNEVICWEKEGQLTARFLY